MTVSPLRVRWLGRVDYDDALALQHGLFEESTDDYLLLLEHPHTYTMGVRADAANILVDPGDVGAKLVRADRGGDVTYHGPGQLVGYPILTLADHATGAMPSTRDHVLNVEGLLVDVLADLGIPGAGILEGAPGVWLGLDTPRPRKIAAIGVRISRGRSMHGFALNVDPDPAMFGHIVPCGITDKGVTSLADEGVAVAMRDVVDAVVARAAQRFARGCDAVDRADVVWRSRTDDTDLAPFSRGEGPGAAVRYSSHVGSSSVRLLGRLAEAGVSRQVALTEPKPDWMRARLRLGGEVLALRSTLRAHGLVTVCEEAGCPNLSECWADGTATFMLCGDRCTRACGFCLVDTSKPLPLDAGEPERVASAVEEMGLAYAVLTMVARDDLADGGAMHVAATIEAIRRRVPGASVEALISDLRGDERALATVFAAAPDVLNHNIETVARLQRAVRPSASYARSLSVLARARAAGLRTKSGMVVGMGETFDEVTQTLADLAAVGTQIVTIGQYLRPTSHHLPVERWWTPDDFDAWRQIGTDELGIGHVESSPLTRSSYHARAAAASCRERVMATAFESLSDEHVEWIAAEHVFFVGTAPLDADGHVNVSPKGYDTFRVLDPTSVAYLDLTGSGVETIAHVRENGRLTVMFCAFEGRPRILRLYGAATVVMPDDDEFAALAERFGRPTGLRSIIRVALDRVADSCGYSIPLLEYSGERDTLTKWAARKGTDGLESYWSEKNATSIDGLPGIDAP